MCPVWPHSSLFLEDSGGEPGNLRGQVEADFREPCSFYRSAPSSKLVEADPYTQIGPSHTRPGQVDAATNNKQHSSYTQVAQGSLHTSSDIDLYLDPAQVDSEPTQPMVDFRQYQSLTQLALKQHTQSGIVAGTRSCWEQFRLRGQHLHSTSYLVIKVYPYSQPV